MSNSGDLVRPVCGVLDDLREVLHVRDMRENGGLQADELELRRTWKRLKEALLELTDVIQKPQPEQGLASVWLRAICEKAAKVEEAAKRYPNGWSDVLFHDDMNLNWLVIDRWQNGYQILKWSRDQQPGLESLLAPKSSLPDRLRRLGEQWTTECENAADERQRNEVDNTYRRQVGDTFLEAVDALHITSKTLEITDFEVQVLRYLDLSAGLVPQFLKEVSGQGLLAFVDRLEQKVEKIEETHRPSHKLVDETSNQKSGEDDAPSIEEPVAVAESPSGALKLFGQHNAILLNGSKHPKLTAPQFNCLQALCEAGPKGVTKDELTTNSGHPGALGILRGLQEKGPAWESVIQMAGVSGGRYRVL